MLRLIFFSALTSTYGIQEKCHRGKTKRKNIIFNIIICFILKSSEHCHIKRGKYKGHGFSVTLCEWVQPTCNYSLVKTQWYLLKPWGN